MKDLVSVILPVYNVEKYLLDGVKSVINQTYDNLEIILVDDGSTDKSGTLCDEYATIDNRIKVFHKKNGGLSDARNKGIDNASGEWIVFVDPDDIIHPQMIEILYKEATISNTKMSWCAIDETDEKGVLITGNNAGKHFSNIGNYEFYETIKYSKQEAEARMYTAEGMQKALVAWNKIYHRVLFSNDEGKITYPYQKIFEDGYTTYKYIYESPSVIEVKIPLYYYRQRTGSIMDVAKKIKYEPALEAGKERMSFYAKREEKALYCQEINLTIYSVIRFFERVKDKSDKKELRKWFNDIYYNYFIKEKWPLGKRIRMKAFLIGYPFYKILSGFEGAYNKICKRNVG